MLQYLVILLDDTSTSFCHYDVSKTERRLMPIETLRQGIRFAMIENLMIQFVYPDYELPQEYTEVIESIDHSKIKPYMANGEDDADVLVVENWQLPDTPISVPLVVRTTKDALFANYALLNDVAAKTPRLNVVVTDVERFTDEDFDCYETVLKELSATVEHLYADGHSPQVNILTDRMMLSEMNNCGAGDTTITLAPNGMFYICPAFYYENETDTIGDLNTMEHLTAEALDIKNRQLYKLDHAPICRHCDAWQCKRCIWLNRKTTLEVNTPSHEQCVMAHIERNASRLLLAGIRQHGTFLPQANINEIDYLDPFDKREEWN